MAALLYTIAFSFSDCDLHGGLGPFWSGPALLAALLFVFTRYLVWFGFSSRMFPGLCEGKFKGKDKSCEVPQSSVGFLFIPVQVPAGVGILGAEASQLLKFTVSAYMSAAAICYELVLVGASVILMGAAASELLYSVLFPAFAAAALFFTVTIVGAFVIWIGAATALLIAEMCSALSASSLCSHWLVPSSSGLWQQRLICSRPGCPLRCRQLRFAT